MSFSNPEGLTLRLSTLDRRTLHDLLAPFLELRQACCHPQLVRGHSLVIKNLNETITMEELLTQLIQKTKLQCGEDHRAVVASLNGAAGIHWLLEDFVEASNNYREILQLTTKNEHIFSTDTLQLLHTLENLADLLDMNCAKVPYTLRDDRLRSDSEALRSKYLETHANGVKAAHTLAQNATSTVEGIRDEFQCKPESWWVYILHRAIRMGRAMELISRIKDDLAVYASKKAVSSSLSKRFTGTASFQNAMIEKITELQALRAEVLQKVENVQYKDPKSFLASCIECHLRKRTSNTNYDYQCRLCIDFEKFSEYQRVLFSEDLANVKERVIRTGRNRQKLKLTGGARPLTNEEERLALLREEEELIKNIGDIEFHNIFQETKMMKDSDTEQALRQLLTFARINQFSAEILQDGATHIKLLDAMKKEFKLLRVLWTRICDRVAALDELSQATTRLTLKTDQPDTPSASTSKKPKALSNWDKERTKKLQTLNLMTPFELKPKLEELKLEYATALSDFNAHHGQLLYLEQLENKSYGRKGTLNQEECPVCHIVLGEEWCVLTCGHSFCSDCIKRVCNHMAQSLLCPLCRHCIKVSEVSFVNTTVEEAQPSTSAADRPKPCTEARTVRGSHSTKVQAVVEQLLQLQASQPGAKVIIFSSVRRPCRRPNCFLFMSTLELTKSRSTTKSLKTRYRNEVYIRVYHKWTVVLDIIGRALEQNGIHYSGLNTESKKNLQNALVRFKERENVQVLLLPISSGSKGLNIIEATHVFLVEPILNLGSELQAIGRVHRIGQTKETFVHRFYVRSTIEEQLFEVLKTHDASTAQEGLLTLGDLKELVTK